MARPREFDEAAVLDAAIEKFWQCGYEATSVRDLTEKMNIAGASLYNAFGDKRPLYERALNRYLDQTFRERIGRLEPNLPPPATPSSPSCRKSSSDLSRTNSGAAACS
jgi:TetR/AcrR family transcriptional regulator, transcriptional repressor for nem operon